MPALVKKAVSPRWWGKLGSFDIQFIFSSLIAIQAPRCM
jgi:hypothetical protein